VFLPTRLLCGYSRNALKRLQMPGAFPVDEKGVMCYFYRIRHAFPSCGFVWGTIEYNTDLELK